MWFNNRRETCSGRLVILVGKAGSGKSTAAAHLCRHGYTEIAMADPLKQILSIMMNWPLEVLKAATEETRAERELLLPRRFGDTEYDYRKAAEVIGDLFRNHFDNNVWVTIAAQRINWLLGHGHNVVVSDARFPNEIDMGLRLGETCIFLAHNEHDLTPDENAHISERAFFERRDQMTIVQTKTIDVMHSRLNDMLQLQPTWRSRWYNLTKNIDLNEVGKGAVIGFMWAAQIAMRARGY